MVKSGGKETSVSELIFQWVEIFEDKTGIIGKIAWDMTDVAFCLLVLGILLVLVGAKIYCFLASLMVFSGVTVVTCILLEGRLDWSNTVTAFTLIGCMLGLLAFKWKKFNAVVLSGLMAACIMWLAYPTIWIVVCAGILTAIATIYCPTAMIIIYTTVTGTALIAENLSIVGDLPMEIEPYMLLAAGAIGLMVQFVLFGRKTEGGQKFCKRFFAKK